jgi:tetratricopeptide (TPR) repeat protein
MPALRAGSWQDWNVELLVERVGDGQMKIRIVMCIVVAVIVLSGNALAQQDVNRVYAQAKQAAKDKDYAKAIELYKQVLQMSPDFSTGYYELACVYALKGDRDEAIESLKTAVEKGYLYFQRMENDPDLKSVRSHRDFKAILKDREKYASDAADKTLEAWKNKLGNSFQYARDDKYKFIVAYEVSAAQMQNIIGNLKLTADSHAKHLFTNKPDYYISVIICSGGQSFTNLLGAAYSRAAGAYVHAQKTLYVRTDTGIGTATHEFTHALHWADALARKQDMQPQWIIEGFGTLYESPTFTGSKEIRSHTSWQNHWRLPGLKQSIENGTYQGWNKLFYGWATINITHAYEMAKYLFLYLQEEGLLYKFYEEYVKLYPDDPSEASVSAAGVKALEKVTGKKAGELEAEWKEWVLSLGKPMMGVYFDQNYTGKGARVEKVESGSPAERGGMKAGDVILEMDGNPVADWNANQELLKKKNKGDKAVFKVKRGDDEMELTLELGVYPGK